MPRTNFHRDNENVIKRRLVGRFQVKDVLCFLKFTKRGAIQRLLHNLKYRHQPEIGVALGQIFARSLIDDGFRFNYDIIIPVPLHHTRLRKRGYNQSSKFAEGIASQINIPVYNDVVVRKRKTLTQTSKTKLERWENVSDVFEVREPGKIRGKKVLLVDDVITTGATIEACALLLLRHGCGDLSIASIAVA